MDTKEKLSGTTIFLHWFVGVGIIAMIAFGYYITNFEKWSLMPLHKSFGVLIFIVVLYRVVWRIKNGWLVPIRDYPTWESVLAKVTHWVMMLGTLIMPISGFVFTGAAGRGVSVFGLVLAPNNPDPLNPKKMIPFNADVAHFFNDVHETLALILTVAIVLHILGSIKHHVIDKDRTLLRMNGK